jgi:DNA-directed RNA polymerase specialized sigma24 family protein
MDGGKTRFAARLRPLRRLSDDDLAAAAAGGDQRAFGVIFERYHAPLYRYCAGILRNSELAAAALQKTMLAALRGLKGKERSVALRPWLYRIANDEAASLLHARPSREALSQSELRDLPERQRSALLLRELNELDYDELAAALEITPSAARQEVFNARRALEPAGGARSPACLPIQTEMSAHEDRFERRRDIRTHLEECPDCRAFATALAERPPKLQALFALPPGVAAAVLGAGREAIGDDPDEEGANGYRRRALGAVLVLAVALASTAAIAALGGFDSGGGGGGNDGHGGGITPVQVAPGGPPTRSRSSQRPPPAKRTRPTSAASAYSTSGERTEATVAGAREAGLPLTGLALGAVVATALALLATGLALRRLSAVLPRA